MAAIRKNTRMPPKAPKVPRGPSTKNPKPRAPAEPPLSCMCAGGPWAGRLLTMYKSRPHTAVFSLRNFRGRYVLGADLLNTARWEDV